MIIDQAALQGNFIEALELSTGSWPIMGLSSTAEISTKTQDRVAEQTLISRSPRKLNVIFTKGRPKKWKIQEKKKVLPLYVVRTVFKYIAGQNSVKPA